MRGEGAGGVDDEVFEIRELAICTVGWLSGLNPAYVMPSLRKTFIQVRVADRYAGEAGRQLWPADG